MRRAELAIVLVMTVLVGACAAPFHKPAPFDESTLRARAEILTKDGVRVAAAIPNLEQSKAIFGVDLASNQIQPVWLEIRNDTQTLFRFLRTGLDPEYFSSLEVAFAYRDSFSSDSGMDFDAHLEALAFRNPVKPGDTVSGFVYTNEDRRTKRVSIDLIGVKQAKNFTLLVPHPDDRDDEKYSATLLARLSDTPVEDIHDEARLRASLEALPCCTVDENGHDNGPLNIVMVGEVDELGPAFARRNYHYRPLSHRYVYGRTPNSMGGKRARWVAAQPHETRLWLAPIRYRGKRVWLGQVITPLGGRFAEPGEDGSAPPMEPNVDEARNDLVQDMVASQAVTTFGWVKGAGGASASRPPPDGEGGPYHSDGLRAVMVFQNAPVAMSRIATFDWERLLRAEER